MSPQASPAWIVHVKTQAKNSHLKAYLACAENPADALRLVQERCKLAAVDGINVYNATATTENYTLALHVALPIDISQYGLLKIGRASCREREY